MRERGAVDFFLQHYIRAERLFEATLLVTQRCNLRCAHCHAPPEPRAELTTRQWRGILDSLAGLGVLQVTFSGGEPLLRRDLVPLLRHADRLGLALTLFSNGMLIDHAFAAAVHGLRWQEIALSVYSPDAAVHDRLTGQRGSWRRTTGALALLAAAGLPVAVNCCTVRGLPGAVGAVREWARERGYVFHGSDMLLPGLDGDCRPLRLRVVKTRPEPPPGPPPPRLRWRRGCGCGEAGVLVNAYGDLFPCTFFPLPFGNLVDAPLAELWHESPLLPVIRRGLDRISTHLSCRACRAKRLCRHCYGQAFIEEGTCWRPPRVSCRLAGLLTK